MQCKVPCVSLRVLDSLLFVFQIKNWHLSGCQDFYNAM